MSVDESGFFSPRIDGSRGMVKIFVRGEAGVNPALSRNGNPELGEGKSDPDARVRPIGCGAPASGIGGHNAYLRVGIFIYL